MSLQTKHNTQPKKGCIRCYLLEKRVAFLEQLLQMKQECREESTQTDLMENVPEELPVLEPSGENGTCASTEKETYPKKKEINTPAYSIDVEGPTTITEVPILFVRVKTEDKKKDVLFLSDHWRIHFLHSEDLFQQITEYGGKYVSLRRLETLVHSWDMGPGMKTEEHEQVQYLLDHFRNLDPFSHRIVLHRSYQKAGQDAFVSAFTVRWFHFHFKEMDT